MTGLAAEEARSAGGQDSAPPSAPKGRGWATVLTSMLILLLGPSVVLVMSFGMFVPALHLEFGWSVAAISSGASMTLLTMMAVSPVQGWLIDRLGVRRLVLTFLPLWAAALIAMSLLPANLYAFYAACVLLPIAGLGLWPLAFMKLAATWFDRRLGIALGLTNTSIGIGAVLMPMVLGAIFAAHGARFAYALLGVAALVSFPVGIMWLREGPAGQESSGADPEPHREEVGLSFTDAVRTRYFWLTAASFLLLGAFSSGLLVHQVSILMDAGIGTAVAISVQSAVGVGSIVGRVGTGWLLDRLRVQRIGPVMYAAGAIAAIVLANARSRDSAIAAALIGGLVFGAEMDVLAMLIRRYLGLRAFGRIYGVVFAIFTLGGALGAGGMAICRSIFLTYRPGLFTLMVMMIVGAGLLVPLGPYRYAAHGRR